VIRAILALALAACSAPAPKKAAMPHHWNVYDKDTLILDVSDQPGPIVSTAMLPPGEAPATNPYLSATSHDAFHENQLHGILQASHDLQSFLDGLRAAGFTVKPE
jgi:hypothetical protein